MTHNARYQVGCERVPWVTVTCVVHTVLWIYHPEFLILILMSLSPSFCHIAPPQNAVHCLRCSNHLKTTTLMSLPRNLFVWIIHRTCFQHWHFLPKEYKTNIYFTHAYLKTYISGISMVRYHGRENVEDCVSG